VNDPKYLLAVPLKIKHLLGYPPLMQILGLGTPPTDEPAKAHSDTYHYGPRQQMA